MNLPQRITTKWLQSLSDETLRMIERELSKETADYQNYAHARRLSDRWQRAYDELKRRGLIQQKRKT